MSVHKKLMQARIQLQNTSMSKSGHNKFAGYKYFELADFVPHIQKIFNDLDLCGYISYGNDTATLSIVDIETNTSIQITSPMSSAALKGCHEVQNLGAVQTYIRRYLWVTALEIVEHDAIDSSEPVKPPQDASIALKSIQASKTLDELKAHYTASYALFGDNKGILAQLSKAKDTRKAELLEVTND